MPLPAPLAARLDRGVDDARGTLAGLARAIHDHPELKFEEHQAVKFIDEVLQKHGASAGIGAGGLSTAFVASAGKKGGPRVAILAEYDALPEIGHACGHNLIATAAVGAFLAAKDVAAEVGGEVVLVGTPAEEGGGGKVRLLEAGVFDGIDAAMMFHPFDRDMLAHPALANLWVQFVFHGVPAHGAAAPHQGKSALTACMDTFRLVDGQRVHFRDGVRVHGYVQEGGRAVNIIPDLAACEFSVRARSTEELARVLAIVLRCAKAAAIASDVTYEVHERRGYKDMRNNMALARAFGVHLQATGRKAPERDERVGAGSTDMGDISHAVPSIHPYLAVVDEGTAQIHDRIFAKATASDRGVATAIEAAKALAKTAVEFLADDALRASVRAEFDARG